VMRVLLVEDDAATSASIALMLKKESFICDTTDLQPVLAEIGGIADKAFLLQHQRDACRRCGIVLDQQNPHHQFSPKGSAGNCRAVVNEY